MARTDYHQATTSHIIIRHTGRGRMMATKSIRQCSALSRARCFVPRNTYSIACRGPDLLQTISRSPSVPVVSTARKATPLSLSSSVRYFETEAQYHPVADEALERIQDVIEDLFDGTSIEYEITLASGVLTFSLPPHGTWVVNKQTPNQQLWWSSPLSGPKRFEYDDQDKLWFSTKDGLNLGRSLTQEIRHFCPELDDFDLSL